MRKYTIPNKKYKMRVNKQVCEYKIPTLNSSALVDFEQNDHSSTG